MFLYNTVQWLYNVRVLDVVIDYHGIYMYNLYVHTYMLTKLPNV